MAKASAESVWAELPGTERDIGRGKLKQEIQNRHGREEIWTKIGYRGKELTTQWVSKLEDWG